MNKCTIWTRNHLWEVIVSVCALAFVLLGITTSSIGIEQLSESKGNDTGVVRWDPQPIRSDEFLRLSPWKIGLLKSGSGDFASPLSSPRNSLAFPDSDTMLDKVVAFEVFAPRLIPMISLAQKFSLVWWLPIYLALMGLSKYLTLIGISRRNSIVATLIIAFSPAVVWWSYLPLLSIAWATLAVIAFHRCTEANSFVVRAIYVALAALFIAKLAFGYLPWNIVLAPPIIFGYLVTRKKYSRTDAYSICFLLGSLALFLILFLRVNWEQISVFRGTNYPGQRRSSGEQMPIARILNSFFTFGMNAADSDSPEGSNKSEFSTLPTIFAVIALARIMLTLYLSNWSWSAVSARTKVFLTFFSIWFSWIFINWSPWSKILIPLSLVPPFRVMQVIGFISALLLLSAVDDAIKGRDLRDVPGLKVALALLITAGNCIVAIKIRDNYLPTTNILLLAVVLILLGVSTHLLLTKSWSFLGMALASFMMLIPSLTVNPIQIGLGDLIGSKSSTYIDKVRSENPEYIWASEQTNLDAIFMSNAITSLSGQQAIGPSLAWKELDPNGSYSHIWNRGASYITFRWSDIEGFPKIYADKPDVITVEVDPCWIKKNTQFKRLIVVESNGLQPRCGKEIGNFQWGGTEHYIFKLD